MSWFGKKKKNKKKPGYVKPCRSLGHHLEISSLLLMATRKKKLTFVYLRLCFLGFVHRHDKFVFSAISGVSSMNSQIQV